MAFRVYEVENLAGNLQVTWKTWLQTTIGISESYARKLRDIANILGQYHRFCQVGISFSEIYTRKREIKSMLRDTACQQYWKNSVLCKYIQT